MAALSRSATSGVKTGCSFAEPGSYLMSASSLLSKFWLQSHGSRPDGSRKLTGSPPA